MRWNYGTRRNTSAKMNWLIGILMVALALGIVFGLMPSLIGMAIEGVLWIQESIEYRGIGRTKERK